MKRIIELAENTRLTHVDWPILISQYDYDCKKFDHMAGSYSVTAWSVYANKMRAAMVQAADRTKSNSA